MIRLLVCICFFIQSSYQNSASPGSVELDEITFHKLTNKFEASLIKFDVAFPYGDKHNSFVEIAKDAQNLDELLVGEVGVKDYGEKDNEKLAMKYGATKDNFPVVKLFVKGKSEPLTFDDSKGFNPTELRRFIREHTGLYVSLPGCVRELDLISIDFIKVNNEKREILLKDAQKIQKKLKGKESSSGKIYTLIMEKIMEKGDDFTKTEVERLNKLLSEKVSEDKKKELNIRLNILQVFQANNPKSTLKEDL